MTDIEMNYSKAASLYTMLLVEQRRWQYDADYEGDRHFEVSSIKDSLIHQMMGHEVPPMQVTVVFDSDEWDLIEEVLEYHSDARGGHIDNEFDSQYSLATIASDLLEDIREARE